MTRAVDEVEFIRAASIRGHLRFWWRALQRDPALTSAALAEAEGALWGHAAGMDGAGRSQVEIWIETDLATLPEVDTSDIVLKHESAYATWPARSQNREGIPPAPRRKEGVTFQLHVTCPADRESEVRNAIRAWILFGGYGGRTRRGLGSLTVVLEEASDWLPANLNHAELERVFGFPPLRGVDLPAVDTPWLAGTAIYHGPSQSPQEAWLTALEWLKNFRQQDGDGGQFARHSSTPKPGKDKRPGRSRWPEPDKVRRLSGNGPWAHDPLHNATPAWPRAGFGLPINTRFQREITRRVRYQLPEPQDYELQWRRHNEQHSRLASPLILKAVPLQDGTFVAAAIWLNRAFPEGGQVVAVRRNALIPNSQAPFERLVAPGDNTELKWLRDASSLRDAFFNYLRANNLAEAIQ